MKISSTNRCKATASTLTLGHLGAKQVPSKERAKLVQELLRLIKGKVLAISMKHDASRVVQTAIQFGSQEVISCDGDGLGHSDLCLNGGRSAVSFFSGVFSFFVFFTAYKKDTMEESSILKVPR